MPDREEILFANEAFYTAFASRDFDALDRIWADHVPVVCIHPGWQPLVGRDAVMQSWEAILGNPDSPVPHCRRPQVFELGEAAFVTCFEELDHGLLVATNYFVREDGDWKLVHHQSGPTSAVVPADRNEPPSTVH